MMRALKRVAVGAAFVVPIGLAIHFKPLVFMVAVFCSLAVALCYQLGALIEDLRHD